MYTATNPFDVWNFGQANGTPSVYGALPYPSASSANLVTFYFTHFNPNILNCAVIGPQAQTYFRVITDNHMPGYTVIKNSEGKNVSLIEWQNHPFIEIRGLLAKQHVRSWMGLTPDNSARMTTIRGVQYTWTPREKSINLYSHGSRPAFLARITRSNGSVVLDVTQDALQLGLLESLISATFLLQCGRNID
ncbi:hypothetical protein BJ165DRAFT_885244 [Panaeolus papilionaceus]|nr:hypothetical protein BJ165DRAFT_885244 [Panaeolus papilionaceus]